MTDSADVAAAELPYARKIIPSKSDAPVRRSG